MTISWSDHGRIVFVFAEAIQGFFGSNLELRISWQVQYLVRIEGGFSCSRAL